MQKPPSGAAFVAVGAAHRFASSTRLNGLAELELLCRNFAHAANVPRLTASVNPDT
jgi:hypothetical protein